MDLFERYQRHTHYYALWHNHYAVKHCGLREIVSFELVIIYVLQILTSVPLELTTVMSMLVVLILQVASTAHVILDTEAMAPVVRVSEHIRTPLLENYTVNNTVPSTTDIDECEEDVHNCTDSENCMDTLGSYECDCNKSSGTNKNL